MSISSKGREVLRSRMKYRKKNNNSWKNRFVAAYCGVESEDPKAPVAQVCIFEDYEKPGQKPKNSVKLESAQIDSSYSGSSTSAYSSTVASRGSTRLSVSPGSFNSGGSGSGVIDSGSETVGGTHIFSIVSKSGEAHEFRTETENDRLRWVRLLQLLIMYPKASIPQEPKINPIKDTLRLRLEAKKYGANSAWMVYILPEGVGTRCGIIGINVLALKSGIPGKQVGTLNIYNPADPTTPLLSWDRDKMRRTGKTGNLVFVEIGRRCTGGPGLVWMYSGFNDAQALRETLHNFLFKGDGTAVPIHTQTPTLYDSPRASFDTNFPPSYQRENSIGSSLGHSNPIFTRSRSIDHDSGFVGSPGSFTSPKLEGPPVRLDKHPSIRRKRDASHPRDIRRSSNSSTNSPLGSFSAEPGFEEGQSSGNHSRSISPQDECDGDVVGCMDPEPIPMYEPVPLGGSAGPRVILRGGDTTAEYETMVHPSANDDTMGGYVQMSKAPLALPNHTNPMSVPKPHAYNTPQHSSNKPNSHNTAAARNNYDTLPTIRETKQDIYVNHPLPQDVKDAPQRVYSPDYQNVDLSLSSEGRRGSMTKEQYENVGGRRQSTKRRDSDHESVDLPLSSGKAPSIGGVRVKGSPPKQNLPDNYVQFQPRNTPAYNTPMPQPSMVASES